MNLLLYSRLVNDLNFQGLMSLNLRFLSPTANELIQIIMCDL